MATKSCPQCGRAAPMLRLVAVSFGVRFTACGRRYCLGNARALASDYEAAERERAVGHAAVTVHRFANPRLHLFRLSMPCNTPQLFDQRLVDAIIRVLEPWDSTKLDETMAAIESFGGEIAKMRDAVRAIRGSTPP
jgi:hypothetical protein